MATNANEFRVRLKPSFLFIGTAKAGSTWFFEVLREHPEVFVPPNKCTHFFASLYSMGSGWYEGFFPRSAGLSVAGEVADDYLARPEALQRVREYRSDMRLVCCLRNPYERAVAAWRFFARNGIEQPTLSLQAKCRPDVFDSGFYASQLHGVRSLFAPEQVLVFFFEELKLAPESVVRRLYEFIGVDPDFVPGSMRRRVNPGSVPRWRSLARVVSNVHDRSWGRSRVASNLVGWVKRFRPLRWAVTAALYSERPPANDWRDYLGEFPDSIVMRYEEEISALERMFERDLTSWRAPDDIRKCAKESSAAGFGGA